MSKIKTINQLDAISKKLRNENKKVITTNGVFDILHIGHIRYLQESKKLGDILIVGINSDSSVKRIKGPKRPLNNENDRAETLAALECVDYVAIFTESDPIIFLQAIKPNIHVKGGDYDMSKIIEKDTVEGNNGKVKLIPEIGGYSTTNYINKIIDAYKDK
jgi:rfaE bifunctional protein nucleotidyltransferase chain/domain